MPALAASLRDSGKLQTSIVESSTLPVARKGVSASLDVVSPSPGVHGVIVRSIYIWKDQTLDDYIESAGSGSSIAVFHRTQT